jgi:hypothetical protein
MQVCDEVDAHQQITVSKSLCVMWGYILGGVVVAGAGLVVGAMMFMKGMMNRAFDSIPIIPPSESIKKRFKQDKATLFKHLPGMAMHDVDAFLLDFVWQVKNVRCRSFRKASNEWVIVFLFYQMVFVDLFI